MPPSSQAIRQSAAELLACAITQLFPNVQLLHSETTEISFSYDFMVEQAFDEALLPLIEEKMREISKSGLEICRLDMMRENAADFFRYRRQPLKAEEILLDVHNVVPIFKMGDFHDYCPLPYAENSSDIKAFKLQKLEEIVTNTPSTGQVRTARITGAAFSNPMELKKFLKATERAKKRDHRLLGKEMDLFSFHDEVGVGDVFWHPKGAVLREILLDRWTAEHREQNYQIVATPGVVKSALLKKAGFYENLEEAPTLFPDFAIDGVPYVLTPTLKPAHALLFKSGLHSYRELPVRYAECAETYGYRKSSQLWGLFRARTHTLDTAHTFCLPSQVLGEVISSLQFIEKNVKMLGLECRWYLVSRRQKSAGLPPLWKEGVEWLASGLTTCGLSFTEDTEVKVANGPRIEARLVDALGREWCGPQVEIDFNHPERFGLRYQGRDDTMHVPVMLARSMFGSLERFIAIIIEHFAGMLPLWLAPEQVRILPLGEKQQNYAAAISATLKAKAIRCRVDYRNDSLGTKVHAAERENIPYVIIIGEQEEKKGVITVRSCSKQGKTCQMQFESFLQAMHKEIAGKDLADATQNVEEE